MPAKLPDGITEDVLTQWADCLGLKTVAGKEALKIKLENVCLLDGKQQDYGSKNISEFGIFGCVVRMSDKLERIKNMTGLKLTVEQREQIKHFKRNLTWLKQNEHSVTMMEVIGELCDQMDQLKKLVGTGRAKKNVNESIRDSFRDGENYNTIAFLVDSGRWPTE